MCGIAGFVGSGNLDVLQRMTRALTHRGPDGENFRRDPPVYFGHRRLVVVDPEGGRQPMTTRDGRYAILFNGEIYNHRALRQELVGLGHAFSSDHSDTEALLIGYQQWGEEVLNRLNGMWAFVVYDRVTKTLFGARDRFGKKPFYYFRRDRDFVFASELSGLIQHPIVSKGVSSIGLRKYFAYGFIPAPHTILNEVRKLPAGHLFRFDIESGQFDLRRYWQYQNEPVWSDPRAAAEEFTTVFRRAVQTRLVADVPVGVFLSGGIDSSAVVAFAKPGKLDVKTFSIGFTEASFDESKFAQRVAQAFKTDHYTRTLSLENSRSLLPEIIHQLDEPMGDPSLLPTFLLCRFAREQVTVALAGDGGDELFCGYDPFRALGRAQAYRRLVPRPLHPAIEMLAARLPVSHRNMSFDFKVKRSLRGLRYDRPFWLPIWMGPLSPKELSDFFRERVRLEEIYEEAIKAWEECGQKDLVSKAQQFFINLYLQDSILTKLDRASMMNSLEARCPFLDPEVVDFARRLPIRSKLRGSETKWILKRALASVLPGQIINRPKKGFGVPIGNWFMSDSFLRSSEGASSAVFRGDYFNRMLREHREGMADHRMYLWNAWLLYQWLAK